MRASELPRLSYTGRRKSRRGDRHEGRQQARHLTIGHAVPPWPFAISRPPFTCRAFVVVSGIAAGI